MPSSKSSDCNSLINCLTEQSTTCVWDLLSYRTPDEFVELELLLEEFLAKFGISKFIERSSKPTNDFYYTIFSVVQ